MRVVITEKPSVARDLARVLGARGKADGYIEGDGLRITWCFGHLAELVDPAHYDPEWRAWRAESLPMLPEAFALQLREDAKQQFGVIKRLLRSKETDDVVNACDAGREGELIFRYVYELAEARKPVRRLWVSSMTDAALRQAWGRLEPGERFDALGDAARSRSEADWLVGLNATRAMTVLARPPGRRGPVLSVGRVQTPTLAMIVRRDEEIATFVPEDFWQVRAEFSPGPFTGTWFQAGGLDGQTEDAEDDDKKGPSAVTRLPTAALAAAVAAATRGRPARIEHAEKRRKVEKPPLLYDLTALQRRANQRYGMSAARTLAVAQALYEKHKLITYPRTDARFLTPDQIPELRGIVEAVGGLAVYAPHAERVLAGGAIQPGKRVVDASEVGDHHAILPEARTPRPQTLDADEKRIYDLVARRLLAVLSADASFDLTSLVVAVDPDPGVDLPEAVRAPLTYRARGRVCVEAGWQLVDPPKQRKDVDLPMFDEGDAVETGEVTVRQDQTRPPAPHNDASILKAMETAGRDLDDAALKRAMRQSGLGTPATRAAILDTLVRREFVERQGKALLSTERGRALVAAVPVEELKSAELTGRWEARLSAIADGKETRAAFMAAVRDRTGEVVRAILAAEPPQVAWEEDDREILGDCPICGTPVREGRGAYSCEKGRDCDFVVFKKIAKRPIAKGTVKQLLKDGRTPVLKRFKSKKGADFEAALVLKDGKAVFDFPPREDAPRGGGVPSDADRAPDPVGLPCPRCGEGRVIRGRAAWGCSRWKAGCDWRRPLPG